MAMMEEETRQQKQPSTRMTSQRSSIVKSDFKASNNAGGTGSSIFVMSTAALGDELFADGGGGLSSGSQSPVPPNAAPAAITSATAPSDTFLPDEVTDTGWALPGILGASTNTTTAAPSPDTFGEKSPVFWPTAASATSNKGLSGLFPTAPSVLFPVGLHGDSFNVQPRNQQQLSEGIDISRSIFDVTSKPKSSTRTKPPHKPGKRPKRDKRQSLPKRPLSAYNFFFQQQRLNGDKHNSPDLRDKWNALSASEKRVYEELAEQDMDRYRQEMMEYKKTSSSSSNTSNKAGNDDEARVTDTGSTTTSTAAARGVVGPQHSLNFAAAAAAASPGAQGPFPRYTQVASGAGGTMPTPTMFGTSASAAPPPPATTHAFTFPGAPTPSNTTNPTPLTATGGPPWTAAAGGAWPTAFMIPPPPPPQQPQSSAYNTNSNASANTSASAPATATLPPPSIAQGHLPMPSGTQLVLTDPQTGDLRKYEVRYGIYRMPESEARVYMESLNQQPSRNQQQQAYPGQQPLPTAPMTGMVSFPSMFTSQQPTVLSARAPPQPHAVAMGGGLGASPLDLGMPRIPQQQQQQLQQQTTAAGGRYGTAPAPPPAPPRASTGNGPSSSGATYLGSL